MTDSDNALRTWQYRKQDPFEMAADLVSLAIISGVALVVLYAVGFYLVGWNAR